MNPKTMKYDTDLVNNGYSLKVFANGASYGVKLHIGNQIFPFAYKAESVHDAHWYAEQIDNALMKIFK